MKRRDVEGFHSFSQEVAKECGIYELGGLLLNDQGEFTAAVEAFEVGREEAANGMHFSALLKQDGYYNTICMGCLLAAALYIPFYAFVKAEGKRGIYQYQLITETDDQNSILIAQSHACISEEDFLKWWWKNKQTVQTKPYRPQLQRRACGSYFDRLLEGRGMKWGGNIDGFLVKSSPEKLITAVIENRYTTDSPIQSYDPAKYFCNDIFTWRPLILLRARLGVPLLLFTYSRRGGEEQMVGLTQVINEPADTAALKYATDPISKKQLRPCDHIVTSAADVKRWLSTL